MNHYNVHVVAGKDLKALEDGLNNIKEYEGQAISVKVTGWDFSFSSFAHWSGTEKQEPDIVLIFDNAEFSKFDLNTGENIGYANLVENLKTAKLNLSNDVKVVLVLSRSKEENLAFLNELIKLDLNNFYFPDKFKVEDIATWILGPPKTLKDNQRYIITSNNAKKPVKETKDVHIEGPDQDKGTSLKEKLLNKLKPTNKEASEDVKSSAAPVIEEPIRVIEKENIITEREYIIKEMDKAYISVYSAATTGKSHTVWNMSHLLAERSYRTMVLNLDHGYTANTFYGIDEIYYKALETLIEKNLYKDILEYAWAKDNMTVLAKGLGDYTEISPAEYRNIMTYARAKQDVIIADCRSGYSELLNDIIRDTSIDILVFDMDLNHYLFNRQLIDKLGDLFIPEKTIAVINNCDINLSAYKYIYEKILEISRSFKDILPISSCGYLGYELMDTGKYPYQEALKKEEHKRFVLDMDNLLDVINARSTSSGNSTLSKSYKFIKNIFKS